MPIVVLSTPSAPSGTYTAQTIIDRAMRLIGALESGETPSTDETADSLVALNQMIDSWRNERLMAYQLVEYTKVMTANDGAYTIGASADINQTRPVTIDSARYTKSAIDYVIRVIDKAAYDAIPDKTTQSDIPQYLYYDPSYANGTVYLWPRPNAADTLTISCWVPLATLATAGTSVSLPPGYERALTYGLAVEIAPEFQLAVPEAVAMIAVESKAALKRMNTPTLTAPMEMCIGWRSDIYAGE